MVYSINIVIIWIVDLRRLDLFQSEYSCEPHFTRLSSRKMCSGELLFRPLKNRYVCVSVRVLYNVSGLVFPVGSGEYFTGSGYVEETRFGCA